MIKIFSMWLEKKLFVKSAALVEVHGERLQIRGTKHASIDDEINYRYIIGYC